jgi:hypothetical protein
MFSWHPVIFLQHLFKCGLGDFADRGVFAVLF